MSKRERDRKSKHSQLPAGVPSVGLAKLTHQELLEFCLYHRPGGWEEFLRRFANLIYATLLKFPLTEAEREELFQASVVVIHRQLSKLRQPELLVPWIVQIASRQALDRLRQKKREAPLDALTDALAEVVLRSSPAAPRPAALPDEEVLRLERAQQVSEALEALGEKCRRLLRALFLEDPPADYREISIREGIAIGTIGPSRARCLEQMRGFFSGRGWLD